MLSSQQFSLHLTFDNVHLIFGIDSFNSRHIKLNNCIDVFNIKILIMYKINYIYQSILFDYEEFVSIYFF